MKEKAALGSQLKLYKTASVPTAIYGSETWNVRKYHETRIQTAEAQFHRGVPCYMRTDQHRNTDTKN